MKKILSAVLAAATLSTATAAIAEGGNWYAGGQLGFAANKTKFSGTTAGTTVTARGSKVGMPLGFQMGWMYSAPSNFFFAAEVAAIYNFAGETKATANNQTQKLKKTWSFEFTPKAGYQFNDAWAAYALLGVSTTKYKLSTPNGASSKFAAGIAPGLGVMYKVDSQWTTNFEYKYQIDQKVEHKSGARTYKAEPRSHVITAKVNYNFS